MAQEKLGPYRLERVLGKGGMGIVYAAVDERTGTRAAVKVLLGNLDDRPNLRVRFEAEIESLKRLRHANIVQLYAYGEEDGQLFYSMELVDGRSLQDELKAGRIFSVPETLRIGLQIAIGLKLAHDSGIIHRDIKPANLLMTREGLVKLTDFGIAKLFGASQVTADGGVVGTADYMSPEQAEGKPVTQRSDLYAVGGVLYALLARVPPFGGRSVPQIIHSLRFDAPPPLRLRAPQTPPEFEELIQKLLAKDPKERVPTALVLAKRLHELAKRYPLPGRPAAAESPPLAGSPPAQSRPAQSPPVPSPLPKPPTGKPPLPPLPLETQHPADMPQAAGGPGQAAARDANRDANRDAEDATKSELSHPPRELTADERYAAAEIAQSLSTVELTWESHINHLVPASNPPASQTQGAATPPAVPLDIPDVEKTFVKNPDVENPDVENPDDGSPLDESAHGLEPLSSEFGSSEAFDADPLGLGELDANAKSGQVTSAPTGGLGPAALPPTLDSRQFRQSPPSLLPPSALPPSALPPSALPPSGAPQSGMAAGTGASGQGDARLSAASSRFTTVAEDEQRRQMERQREALQERSHFLLKTIAAVVVVALLAGGAILLSLPPGADSLYEELRSAASRDDDEALAAVESRLQLFLESHPGDSRVAEVAAWKAKLDLAAEQRRFDRRFRRWDSAAAMGPIERLYGEAMQEAATRPDRALDRLRSLVDAYAAHPPDDASAQRSLKLAAGQIERLEQLVKRQRAEELTLAREQLRWADEQRTEAPEKAAAVYRGLATLYVDKPWAQSLLDELKPRLAPPTAQ